jgi:hypothetical protein
MQHIGTLDELISQLEEARDEAGGDVQVRVACQPGWPLRGTIETLTVTGDQDEPDDPRTLWIALGSAPCDENPYAPHAAWGPEDPGDGHTPAGHARND